LLFFLNCSIDDESRSLGFLLSDLLKNVEDIKFIQQKKWFILLLLSSTFLGGKWVVRFFENHILDKPVWPRRQQRTRGRS
jgi:hypothetical protein